MRPKLPANVCYFFCVLLSLGMLSIFSSSASAANQGPPHPPGEDDDDAPIHYEVPKVEAHRGETVNVPLQVRTEAPLTLLAFSLEHDPAAFRVDGASVHPDVPTLIQKDPDQFIWFVDDVSGWVQVLMVTDFESRTTFAIPVSTTPTSIVDLSFKVMDDAPEGEFPLTFTRPESERHGHFKNNSDEEYFQYCRRDSDGAFDDDNELDEGEEPALVDGAILVSIIGDVGIFVRGDANIDRALDISDPVKILLTLFTGAGPLNCEDAADANDDGQIDLADPITLLNFLFRQNTSVGLSPEVVTDTTPDLLGCAQY